MKEKLLQFFTGKMGKSVYISTVAAVVCGAVVITSTVIVHNNNQKIDAVLESLSASESMSESDTESTTGTVSETQTNTASSKNEPSGDKALQYLAEYDKLTKEYEAKRAELMKQTVMTVTGRVYKNSPEPQSRPRARDGLGNYLETEEEYNAYLAEFQKQHDQWEQESQRIEAENIEVQRKGEEERARIAEVQNQINALDAQYEKDVADLKARYGMS